MSTKNESTFNELHNCRLRVDGERCFSEGERDKCALSVMRTDTVDNYSRTCISRPGQTQGHWHNTLSREGSDTHIQNTNQTRHKKRKNKLVYLV